MSLFQEHVNTMVHKNYSNWIQLGCNLKYIKIPVTIMVTGHYNDVIMGMIASQITSLYILNRLFRRRSKKTSKLLVTGLCAGNSPGTGEFLAQTASNAENVSIWWRYHGIANFSESKPMCRGLSNQLTIVRMSTMKHEVIALNTYTTILNAFGLSDCVKWNRGTLFWNSKQWVWLTWCKESILQNGLHVYRWLSARLQ